LIIQLFTVNEENWALPWEAAHTAVLLLPLAARRLRGLLKASVTKKRLAMCRISWP